MPRGYEASNPRLSMDEMAMLQEVGGAPAATANQQGVGALGDKVGELDAALQQQRAMAAVQGAQQPAAEPQGAAFGERGFQYQRMRPGQAPSSARINPATGMPMTYQDFMQSMAPEAFRGSVAGGGAFMPPPTAALPGRG